MLKIGGDRASMLSVLMQLFQGRCWGLTGGWEGGAGLGHHESHIQQGGARHVQEWGRDRRSSTQGRVFVHPQVDFLECSHGEHGVAVQWEASSRVGTILSRKAAPSAGTLKSSSGDIFLHLSPPLPQLTPILDLFQTVEGAEAGPVWEGRGGEQAAADPFESRHAHWHSLASPPNTPEEWTRCPRREGPTQKWGHMGPCRVRGVPQGQEGGQIPLLLPHVICFVSCYVWYLWCAHVTCDRPCDMCDGCCRRLSHTCDTYHPPSLPPWLLLLGLDCDFRVLSLIGL